MHVEAGSITAFGASVAGELSGGGSCVRPLSGAVELPGMLVRPLVLRAASADARSTADETGSASSAHAVSDCWRDRVAATGDSCVFAVGVISCLALRNEPESREATLKDLGALDALAEGDGPKVTVGDEGLDADVHLTCVDRRPFLTRAMLFLPFSG